MNTLFATTKASALKDLAMVCKKGTTQVTVITERTKYITPFQKMLTGFLL
jgi:hypothetical protein